LAGKYLIFFPISELAAMKQLNNSLHLSFWHLKYFSCGVHLRNKSRLFLATQTLDADIWTTNQNIQKAWHTFVY